MIELLLVDDQKLFVESLKYLLEGEGQDIRVSGIAYNSDEALAILSEKKIDVVLLDVRMPGIDGVATARLIHNRWPKTHVIMLTTFDDDHYVLEALRHGAAGYLLKDIEPDELIVAVHAVVGGGVMMSPSVARKLTRNRDGSVEELKEEYPLLERLNPKNIEVLRCLVDSLSNREIAETMNLAEQTVRNYVSSLYAKLGVTCRSEAIRVGRRLRSAGLI